MIRSYHLIFKDAVASLADLSEQILQSWMAVYSNHNILRAHLAI